MARSCVPHELKPVGPMWQKLIKKMGSAWQFQAALHCFSFENYVLQRSTRRCRPSHREQARTARKTALEAKIVRPGRSICIVKKQIAT